MTLPNWIKSNHCLTKPNQTKNKTMKLETQSDKYLAAFAAKRKALNNLLMLEDEGADQGIIDRAERELNRLRQICKDMSAGRVNEAILRSTN
jgi:hypothetical protein